MSDSGHVLHVEQLADEIAAAHRAKCFLPGSEQFVPSSYAGLSSPAKAIKYAGCEYVNGNGGMVRRLSQREIAELHRHIARLKGESIAAPVMRRAVV